MIPQVWQKSLPVILHLCPQDQACQLQPLPLYLSLQFNHYLGFYHQPIQQFFFRYAIHPFDEQDFWLEWKEKEKEKEERSQPIQLKSTEIIVNLYMRLWRRLEDIPNIVVHFRRKERVDRVDLVDYYRQNLKASICLKFRKQGVGVLFSSFSNDQINGLLVNLRNSDYERFYGTDVQEQGDVGFKILMKFDNVPVRIFVGQEKIERSCDPNLTISELIKTTFGGVFEKEVYLWGVSIPLDTRLSEISDFCHADGFIYLFVEAQ